MYQPNRTIANTRRLMAAVGLGHGRLTASADDVLDALESGRKAVLVEVPWRERRGLAYHDRLQILILRREDDRIVFAHGLAELAAPGETIGGGTRGPIRRAELGGLESMTIAQFRALFGRRGRAIVRG